jgi:hypothetical protein
MGTTASYSYELLEKAADSNSVEIFPHPLEIEVIEGYSDGKADIIT